MFTSDFSSGVTCPRKIVFLPNMPHEVYDPSCQLLTRMSRPPLTSLQGYPSVFPEESKFLGSKGTCLNHPTQFSHLSLWPGRCHPLPTVHPVCAVVVLPFPCHGHLGLPLLQHSCIPGVRIFSMSTFYPHVRYPDWTMDFCLGTWVALLLTRVHSIYGFMCSFPFHISTPHQKFCQWRDHLPCSVSKACSYPLNIY